MRLADMILNRNAVKINASYHSDSSIDRLLLWRTAVRFSIPSLSLMIKALIVTKSSCLFWRGALSDRPGR
jgi:hypothetical protein